MLRRIAVADREGFVQRIDLDQPRGRQGLARDLLARQHGHLALHLGFDRGQHRGIVGQQQYLRIRAMLGLRQQVGGDERRLAPASAITSTGGTGRHIDGGGAILRDLLLGFGNEAVARPEQLVTGRNAGGAIGHRSDRLRRPANTRCTPVSRAATSTAGSALRSARGGVHSTTCGQPASCAGTPSISAVGGSGALPAGT